MFNPLGIPPKELDEAMDNNLNRYGTLPLYYQIRENLRFRIEKGTLKEGDLLPSENTLAADFGVSRQVARRALVELANEGLIVVQKGVGSFVNAGKITKDLPILTSYTKSMSSASGPDASRTVVAGINLVAPPDKVVQQLKLASGEEVVFLRRLGFLNEEPVTILEAWYPISLARDLLDVSLDGVSVYEWLHTERGLVASRSDNVLEVTFANAQQGALLRLREGTPLIMLSGTAYEQHGKPFEYTAIYYRSDRFRFTISSHPGTEMTDEASELRTERNSEEIE